MNSFLKIHKNCICLACKTCLVVVIKYYLNWNTKESFWKSKAVYILRNFDNCKWKLNGIELIFTNAGCGQGPSVSLFSKFVAISYDFTQLGFTLFRTFDCLNELTEFDGLIRWMLDLWFFVKSHCLLLKPGSLLANISGALPFTAQRKEFPRTVATGHLT